MVEEVKEGMKTMSRKIDNTITGINIIKCELNKFLVLKSVIHKMRNLIEKLSRRLILVEERLLAYHRLIGMMHSKEKKKTNEEKDNIREMKWTYF